MNSSTTGTSNGAAAVLLALMCFSAHAQTVWNVNVGSSGAIGPGNTYEIKTSDNHAGAAPGNTANSTWNAVTASGTVTLADSTGSTAANVSLTISPTNSSTVDFSNTELISGDKIFVSWMKDGANANPITVSFGNLGTTATYDLYVYDDWYYNNGLACPITQTAGSGLSGTVYANSDTTKTNGYVKALTVDPDPANTPGAYNYYHLTGLTPDGSGKLTFSMGGTSSPINGFQLVQMPAGPPDNTAPTPDPMSWASTPSAIGGSSIAMTATTATDPSGVEYFFTCTAGGGHSSTWQDSPSYTDTGLSPNTSYTYTVKARDKSAAHNETSASSSASATTGSGSVSTTVWNVNIGNVAASEIATTDNYAGAAPENTTPNSTWNNIASVPQSDLLLKDSTGSVGTGVKLDLTSSNSIGNQSLTSGDKIFTGYIGGAGATSDLTIKGLSMTNSYDLVFYSDWYWRNGDGLPISQTLGTGMTGTVYLNRILSGSNGVCPALTEDTNPANVTSGAGNVGNWYRIKNLSPTVNGELSFLVGDGANTAFSGFQLIASPLPPKADMVNISLPGNPPSILNGVINGTDITLKVPYGTNVTNLEPVFDLWPGATSIPVSGSARDFTTPKVYTVTSSDSLVVKNYTLTVVVAPPLPEFYLTAPSNWDGRQTITAQPVVTNPALLQANNGTSFTYQWSVDGIAVKTSASTSILSLIRSQGSGQLVVTLTMANGTEGVTRSITINVQEPASDPWVERTPGTTEKAVNDQFIARNPNTNLGMIYYNGTQAGTPDTVYLKVYKTPEGGSETLDATYRQPLVGEAYAFSAPVAAGLITYRLVYGTTTGGVDSDVAVVTGLHCGDAFIIDGQSNAEATGSTDPQVDTSYPWIYTYDATLGWGHAYAKPTSPKWGSKIGFWGMKLAQDIVANRQVPVCFINGAVGGTRIDEHQANPEDHTQAGSFHAIYADLLNRVIAARLTHGIRGIFWHQGESDCSNFGPISDYDYTAYEKNFLSMSIAWKEDYPNVQGHVIHQVMPKPCSIGPKGDELRNALRKLPRLYSKMSILHTLGNAGYEGCHFSKSGYENMAARLLPVVLRDFYGVNPGGPVTAPNLKRAWFTSTARTAIALEFDQAMSWSSFSLPNWYVDDVGGQVTSGSESGNIVTLQLSSAAAANATLDYVKDSVWSFSESVSTLLYGVNAIPALTFANVAIESLTPYQQWATGYPGADLSNPAADFDGDGLSNNEEYLWGLDPTRGGSTTPILTVPKPATGTLSYQRRNPALTGATFTYPMVHDAEIRKLDFIHASDRDPERRLASRDRPDHAARRPFGESRIVRPGHRHSELSQATSRSRWYVHDFTSTRGLISLQRGFASEPGYL